MSCFSSYRSLDHIYKIIICNFNHAKTNVSHVTVDKKLLRKKNLNLKTIFTNHHDTNLKLPFLVNLGKQS